MGFAKLLIGPLYHSHAVDQFEHMPLAAIGVNEDGIIEMVKEVTQDQVLQAKETIRLGPNQFLIPGFVDTHIHAPQYVFTGTGYDLTLLDWLEKYTFPAESAFHSTKHALDSYSKVVSKSLNSGTTCACYFATIHRESSLVLAQTVANLGQRAYIGKVNMDQNSPEFYKESLEQSIQETVEFIQAIKTIHADLITPVITPRFAPTCSAELMNRLADLAALHDLPIQSHLSETPSELDWVSSLFPECKDYASVYDSCRLLTKKTVMAHCCHLSESERDLLRMKKVGISHCPSSNFCLLSGVLNVRRLLEEGHEKIGLGTDVAGGYSFSVMDSIRQAITASKVIHLNSREQKTGTYEPLSFSEAFYLATLGGAKCLGLDESIGNFAVGKKFDALLIDVSNIDFFDHDDHLSKFEKFVYLGDDRNVKQVFVSGSRVIKKD
jgi:guanine deaminase